MEFVFIQMLFIWIAFFIGAYAKHLWHTPKQWRWVVKGMWASKTFITFGILIAMSVGVYFINAEHVKTLTKAGEQRQTEIMDTIKDDQQIKNQNFQDLINRIDKLIATMEASNATNK